ncbi:hypothetical protein T05_15714 [Trichinella murrelli]|uniref:Uncharacterized protein n=1 Tax=Trichinella murrelli TaxID=144512 RepID=A0A0V0TCR4_9BILA|nr:hypothetical protein T05_15714 [Trichinella murrelli]
MNFFDKHYVSRLYVYGVMSVALTECRIEIYKNAYDAWLMIAVEADFVDMICAARRLAPKIFKMYVINVCDILINALPIMPQLYSNVPLKNYDNFFQQNGHLLHLP